MSSTHEVCLESVAPFDIDKSMSMGRHSRTKPLKLTTVDTLLMNLKRFNLFLSLVQIKVTLFPDFTMVGSGQGITLIWN